MKKYLFSLLFIFQCLLSFAQGEGNHWYFGYTAGLDFTSGTPLPDLNGALNTWEGCSAVILLKWELVLICIVCIT